MEILLVGGAVRDNLLGLTPRERDWVVVGATPQQLLDQGYHQVGKDFPVFLHPKTREEYALARIERKTGVGYTGFACESSPHVTLEEDLLRRDLTVNAMAQTSDGRIIDPYGGQQDLQDRVLRHVSPAFAEDPLRVLRVARFAARYHGLDFRVAPETLELMKNIAASGELDYLVPERVWQELAGALSEAAPAEFIRVLRACNGLKTILPEVDCLFGVPQTEKYHPEIDTGEHILLALDMVASLTQDPEVRYAVLVHDLGKGVTPQQEWPSHRGHEQGGVPLIENVAQRLRVPKQHTQLAKLVSRYHLHCHRAFELRAVKVLEVLEAGDGLRRPDRFEKFLLACEADARGRAGLQEQPYPQADHFRRALSVIAAIKPEPSPTISGKAIGEQLKKARLQALIDVAQMEA